MAHGLVAMLEQSKDVALAAREAAAMQSAQDIVEFEEFGADLAKAFDEEELAAAEEALRLGLKLDEEEDEVSNAREQADLDLARTVLEKEESVNAECSKDEVFAKQLEAQLRKEALEVSKLEKRERELAHRKLCKDDLRIAEQLAADIERQEAQLIEDERRDRRLARELVKSEGKLLAELPQTEEKLRTLAREFNGSGEEVAMRTKMHAKLGSLRKGLSDLSNKLAL